MARAFQADSEDPEALRSAISETVDGFGGLEILVNNAGTAYIAPIEEFPLAEYERILAVNVRAIFVAIQAAIPHLAAGGRIINIGSTMADRAPVAGISVYSLSKAAVAGLTRGLARELGPRGITVNTVQPGPVETDTTPDSGEFADAMRSMTAVGHFGQPQDIADVVAFLAADRGAVRHWCGLERRRRVVPLSLHATSGAAAHHHNRHRSVCPPCQDGA